MKSVYHHIPKEIRGNNPKSAIQRAATRSRSSVNIPQVVQDLAEKREMLFPKVQNVRDGEPTYDRQSSLEDLQRFATHSDNPLAKWYEFTVDHERKHELYKIRLRFLYVMFYRLKQWIEPESRPRYSNASDFIAQVILNTGSSSDSPEVVRNKVRGWVGHGERYELLAKDLGGLGVLYILPDYGGETL